MCGLLTLLLAAVGFFGFFGVSSAVIAPPISEFETVEPQFVPSLAPTQDPMFAFPTATPQLQGLPPTTPENEVLSICPPPETSDFDLITGFAADYFDSNDWNLTATKDAGRTRFTWVSNSMGSIAMIELVHFACGYTDADVEAYYTDSTWDVIFSGYESWEETATCRLDDGYLYEFDLEFGGYSYKARYWIDPVSEQQLGNVMLVFLEPNKVALDEYAALLYPEFSSCEGA